jgi:hypothetical protein
MRRDPMDVEAMKWGEEAIQYTGRRVSEEIRLWGEEEEGTNELMPTRGLLWFASQQVLEQEDPQAI